MSGMDRHSELQQHKTAAEYRQAADEQIGNKVKYIQLRISAQEGVSS